MDDKHDEYLQHALYCIRMAEAAAKPEIKSNWQRLAEKWLSMVRGEAVPQNLSTSPAQAKALDQDQPETRQSARTIARTRRA